MALAQLPGREARLSEPPLSRMGDLLGPLTQGLRPHLTGRFAFFGYSMGSLIAFELARRLRTLGMPGPEHLFVACHRAPHLPFPRATVADQPETVLREELQRMGGTPQHILEHPELMDLLLPVIRADLGLCETYRYEAGPPLSCPITAYGGVADGDVPDEHLKMWSQFTTGPFQLRLLPGGHFAMHTDPGPFAEALSKDLAAQLATRP